MAKVSVNEHILKDLRYDLIFSVEAVNQYVLEGMPFREAYLLVAKHIQDGTFIPPKELNHSHLGSIGNLGNEEIKARMEQVYASFA